MYNVCVVRQFIQHEVWQHGKVAKPLQISAHCEACAVHAVDTDNTSYTPPPPPPLSSLHLDVADLLHPDILLLCAINQSISLCALSASQSRARML